MPIQNFTGFFVSLRLTHATMPRWVKQLLRVSASVLILVLLFLRVDEASLLRSLAEIRLPQFVLAATSLLPLFLLPAFAQHRLFAGVSLRMPLLSIYSINLKSMFYSLVLPGDVASATARFIKFSKIDQSKNRMDAGSKSAPIVTVTVVDRLLNIQGMALLAGLLVFTVPLPGSAVWFQRASGIIFVAIGIAFALGRSHSLPRLLRLGPPVLHRVLHFFEEAARAFGTLTLSRMGIAFLILALYQFATVAVVDLLLASSLNLTVPLLPFIAISAIVRLARYIPITFSGIGVREGLYPLFLAPFGVPLEISFGLGLIGSSVVILYGALGALLEAIEIGLPKRLKARR